MMVQNKVQIWFEKEELGTEKQNGSANMELESMMFGKYDVR